MLKAMNSLNIVSRLTTTPPPSPPSRSRTSSAAQQQQEQFPLEGSEEKSAASSAYDLDLSALSERLGAPKDDTEDEKTPLLGSKDSKVDAGSGREGRLWQIPKRIAHAVLYGATVVFSTLAAPGRYVIACFYDHDGHFSAVMPLRNFRTLLSRRKGGKRRGAASKPETLDMVGEKEIQPKPKRTVSSTATKRTRESSMASSPLTSEDERTDDKDTPARHTRSQTSSPTPTPDLELAPHRKTAKVKLLPNDEALRKRKSARQASKSSNLPNDELASSLKSPSSPTSTSKLTKYPRLPAPPRPLVPRRQPSYTLSYSPTAPKKTLVIDLDETLIHSMARGGRMGTGHMVEVRLNQNYGSSSGPGAPGLAPGVPILYYVHPRPYVHHFLRTMSLYFSLVVFTASVQEYADPVVDWLERERKYFDKRLYRQHCSQRGGMFVKDLSRVEADLSRVVILDNFPGSYVFQEDNAIPIEGWISDPTDRELLHLIPLLEGLQYVTDVRAILQLRQGQGVVA
ncbi:Nuclear envelope morphology protein 1 [Elasticomyces elasticus]|nr:Nuclear envelope morphology protein 1 [Elasticomyces elasticus]KAK3659245.1 Nuclear envelope morphology protein 1 [Elasticomyces elasticus]KAK4914771.1 Nuclear envelope morphology protein 1 [Elasticomyces elasticus]KAK5754241.1 Nuclear envelope morphology protein 1 [Elasticomyces elasticus]